MIPYNRTALESMTDWMDEIHRMNLERRFLDLGSEVLEAVPAIDSLPGYVQEALIGFMHDLSDAGAGFCRLLGTLAQMRTEELDKSKYTLTVYNKFRNGLREIKTYDDEQSYVDDCVSYEEDPRYATGISGNGRHTMVCLRSKYCEEDE